MPVTFCMVANSNVPVVQFELDSTGGGSKSSEVVSEAEALRKKIKLEEDGKNADVCHIVKGSTFCWLIDDGMLFLCLATGKSGKTIAFQFLEKIQNEFYEQFGVRGKATKLRLDMNMDFVPVVKKIMADFNKKEVGVEKVTAIKEDVDKVTENMKQNINKALERGEQIETLVDKTNSLNDSSNAFKNSSKTLRRTLWWQNMKIMIFGGVFCLILFILLLWWLGAF